MKNKHPFFEQNFNSCFIEAKTGYAIGIFVVYPSMTALTIVPRISEEKVNKLAKIKKQH